MVLSTMVKTLPWSINCQSMSRWRRFKWNKKLVRRKTISRDTKNWFCSDRQDRKLESSIGLQFTLKHIPRIISRSGGLFLVFLQLMFSGFFARDKVRDPESKISKQVSWELKEVIQGWVMTSANSIYNTFIKRAKNLGHNVCVQLKQLRNS